MTAIVGERTTALRLALPREIHTGGSFDDLFYIPPPELLRLTPGQLKSMQLNADTFDFRHFQKARNILVCLLRNVHTITLIGDSHEELIAKMVFLLEDSHAAVDASHVGTRTFYPSVHFIFTQCASNVMRIRHM